MRQRDETNAIAEWGDRFAIPTISGLLFLCLVLLSPDNRVLADDSETAQSTAAKNRTAFEVIESVDGTSLRPRDKGTRVSLPIDLEPLHRAGGIPRTLDILRLMEQQQRRVAARASKCTVSVKIRSAQGCGVIITGTGFIVTAAHVAMRPDEVAMVTLSDGRKVVASTLGMNRHVDAGLIRINPGQNGGKSWPHASLGTSDDLVPGMWCIAMGHPGGYDAARGAVIRVGRLLEVRPDVVVSDCALIGGDSGGPLFNMAGELIAVHSRIGNDVADNLHVPIDHYDYSWDRMAEGDTLWTLAEIEAQNLKMDMPKVDVEIQVVDGDIIKIGNLDVEVWHTPGHTNSQLAFRIGDVLLSGDNIYRDGCIGAVDAHHGSDIKSFIHSLERIRDSDVKWLAPSHGPIFANDKSFMNKTIDRVRGYLQMADFGTLAESWPLMDQWDEEVAAGKLPDGLV